MSRHRTYGGIVRARIARTRLSLRQVAGQIGYSYEQVRKASSNGLHLSRKFNDNLCQFLGLDSNDMWCTLQREKLRAHFNGPVPKRFRDQTIVRIWNGLTPQQREDWKKIAIVMAEANERAARAKQSGERTSSVVRFTGTRTEPSGQIGEA